MLKAVILDDELNCIEVLKYELNKMGDKVQVTASFQDPVEALKNIEDIEHDVIFLDIEMPRLNAFQFLDALPDIKSKIIFTTAYDHYALKAFRYYAVDYLLKPISGDDLAEALDRVHQTVPKMEKTMIDEIYNKIKSPNSVFTKIAIPVEHGYQMVKIEDIVYCEADSNYAHIILSNSKRLTISKTLKYLDNLLRSHGFYRVHQSKLVNVNYIENYSRVDGGVITLVGNYTIPVSRANRKGFELYISSFGGLSS
ncbi:MAG: LytTR family DNA-binding domain-containing protein [Saprospiraceae bacterium]|nr:LytTR family DNA-binding domain-containing protein [Saprospiraceae bacterium]